MTIAYAAGRCRRKWPDVPGQLVYRRGTVADYRQLAALHYLPKRPATFAGVWAAEHIDRGRSTLAAVAVLSWPVPSVPARRRALGELGTRREELAFANAHIRTISRVIVHPIYRSLGLAAALIRCVCSEGPTRYVESIARMGAVHPMFDRAGMRRVDPVREGEATYFLFDREAQSQVEHISSPLLAS